MSPKWLIGLFLLWIAGLGLDRLVSGGYFATTSGTGVSSINIMFQPLMKLVNGDFIGIFTTGVFDGDWWLALLKAFSWDFVFFRGTWVIGRIIMICVSIGIAYGVVRDMVSSVRP